MCGIFQINYPCGLVNIPRKPDNPHALDLISISQNKVKAKTEKNVFKYPLTNTTNTTKPERIVFPDNQKI